VLLPRLPQNAVPSNVFSRHVLPSDTFHFCFHDTPPVPARGIVPLAVWSPPFGMANRCSPYILASWVPHSRFSLEHRDLASFLLRMKAHYSILLVKVRFFTWVTKTKYFMCALWYVPSIGPNDDFSLDSLHKGSFRTIPHLS